MLYELLSQLVSTNSIFNVFRYITVRSALAGVSAFLICLVFGPYTIRKLSELSIGQSIREEGPSTHQVKAGTPTMGGILILFAVVIATLAWANPKSSFIWIQLVATVGFGLVGFIDDLSKVLKKRSLGLSAKGKMAWLILISLVVVGWMMWLTQQGLFTTRVSFPFAKDLTPEFAWAFLPFGLLVLLGTSNAVNLTDGLDGLAIGSSGFAFGTFTVIAYVTGHAEIAEYLQITHVGGTAELTVFGAAMVGACLGFLWHNAHPALVFMGDTGALGLGGALGCMALLTTHPFLLVIAGGLFVLEALSVILQVGSFRLRGKRIFKMAPLHHHFELKGWHESQVIIRFWIVAILFSILALSTLKLR